MNLLCFGIAKEIIGTANFVLSDDASITNVADLKQYLRHTYPEFHNYKDFRVAVNQAFAEDTTPISPTDEIAIIPPVSGG